MGQRVKIVTVLLLSADNCLLHPYIHRFTLPDVAGAASVISPSVLLCACFNGGECVVEGVSIDMPVLTLSCLCDEGIYT